MKIVIVLIVIALLFSGLVLVRNNVGDLRPSFIPSIKTKKISPLPVKFGKPLDVEMKVPEGFQIGYFAENIGPVRDLVFSPGGVLLAIIPSEGKVVMLPDRTHDGIADEITPILGGLDRPHGIAFYNNYLYVAEETKVSRYIWSEQKLVGGVARLDKKLFDLPKGGRHFTRSIVFDNKGTMYVSLGSTCDVCKEQNDFIAAVIVSDNEGKTPKLYATGLRNAVFLTMNPDTEELWGTEMGRDFLGDNLPPDEINIIQEGKDYGWPFCYGNKIHDTNFDKNVYKQDPCINTIAPVYEISAHSAPLGLTFIDSDQFPKDWQGDLLVAYHGSWNRSSPVGYKIVRLDVDGNSVKSEEDFLTGFIDGGTAFARPVDLEFDKNGYLYVSDDKGGNIFVIGKKQ